MDQIGEPLQSQNLEGFSLLVGITNGVGIILIILVIVWTSHFRLGFAWTSDPQREFNWHPLLMTIGFVFLYSNAMLLYRIQRTVRKRRLKLLHGGIMLFIVLFVVIALVAVFDSHNLNTKDGKSAPIPNMYSLHSWIGMTTVILFCCQWVAGCVSFMYPGIQTPLRAAYMPIHVYFGTAGFVGAVTSCLLGLNEKAIFSLSSNYSAFSPEGVLINVIGLFFIIFGGLTVYLISQSRYKRLPRPEDDVLLAGRTE